MSVPIVIDKFRGIAPRFGNALPLGYATKAENCDLKSEKIRPLAAAKSIQADTNKYNSLFFHDNKWHTGNNCYFLDWKIDDYDILFYLDETGNLRKIINGDIANVGQTRPNAPTLAQNGAGILTGGFYYFITTVRNVGGYKDESGPSGISTIIVSSKQIRITRPTSINPAVIYWRIYRMSTQSGEYQYVAELNISETYYDDNIADSDLSGYPNTWYTSDQGNEIIHDKPQITFNGLITKPYAGMIFGWKDSTLYWNEPGYPDSWPSFYNMNFPSDIKRVIPMAGAVGILTEKGPMRLDGTHPELLQASDVLGDEPCISEAAYPTNRGIIYLSDSGITLFNMVDTKIITDKRLTEDWFKDNVDFDSAFLIDNDEKIYLFYDKGILVGDGRFKNFEWITLDIIAYAAHKREDNGEVYYIDDTGIKQLESEEDYLTWNWMSGDIIGKNPLEKPFESVEIIGRGTVQLKIYVNDELKASKALSWSKKRDRTLGLPSNINVKAIQIEMEGNGEVDKTIIIYSP